MFTLADTFLALGRKAPDGSQNIGITGVQIDSRLDVADRLFVAIRTSTGDGNRFVRDAFSKGAVAAVVEESTPNCPDCRQLVVKDAVAALQKLAAHLRHQRSKTQVIGVTGSNGKTTTKEALASALSAVGKTVKSPRSFNNELGVPITLAEIDDTTDFAVLEMGAQVVGEIAQYCRISNPDAGIICNIGRAHLGLFGSPERVAEAKSELATSIGSDGVVVLNRDDPWSDLICQRTRARIAWFGMTDGKGVKAHYSALPGLQGCRIRLLSGHRSATIQLPSIGYHLARSFAAALSCGEALGLDFGTLIDGLRNFHPAVRRMQVKELHGITIVDDSYNANLNSMQYALAELKRAAVQGRKVAVLGDMLELGEFTESDHQSVGSAALFLDELITVGDKAQLIGQTASHSGFDPSRISHVPANPMDPASIREALLEVAGQLRRDMRPGDVVLLKGSNALGLHRLTEKLGLRATQ